MKNIVVFGAGGHAKAVIDAIEREGRYRIFGLLDSYKAAGSEIYGYRVLGNEHIIADHREEIHGCIVAIGDNWTRALVAARIASLYPGLSFVTAVHPGAWIARGAELGQGTVVMAGAVVNSDTVIGEHCVLYPKASVDHDSKIGDYVTLAPGATTGGNVTIGEYSVLSLGANVIHSVSVGEHTVIGAGATVLSDIGGYAVAYGTPAVIARSRTVGESYL
ncbi:sugar O-acyltransferase, sialic acid O-acetyltransferase NeuD family [Paenibacillus sophorae]|uniref:Acetyltransferase n=1 Tax=Paenibacillus sophorae TaxID=1333845 RepID=A0A1H8RP60_9BACL|nr:acetyltransferase [Paenibacillus sophorae]QWU17044.1 acetyltransferase [Paenibacillus sophorae]SEO67968.1 sugar O-acyltransferase, sialic acid O-acetyltransferase NeuD family [Paenibacillus sophorae]